MVGETLRPDGCGPGLTRCFPLDMAASVGAVLDCPGRRRGAQSADRRPAGVSCMSELVMVTVC